MAFKKYRLYIDGALYESLESARRAAREKLGSSVSMKALLEAADIHHLLTGPGGEVSVSRNPPEKPCVEEEPLGRVPLLRYPPGEGPLHDWSWSWK